MIFAIRGQNNHTTPIATQICRTILSLARLLRFFLDRRVPDRVYTKSNTAIESIASVKNRFGYEFKSMKFDMSVADAIVALVKTGLAAIGTYTRTKIPARINAASAALFGTLPDALYTMKIDSTTPKSNGSTRTREGNSAYWSKSRVAALIGLSAALTLFVFHPENVVTVALFATSVVGLAIATVIELFDRANLAGK